MVYTDLIAHVIKDMKAKKFSSFLTFFAISLGIFAIFLIFLLSIGFENSVENEFAKLGTNRLYISPTGSNFGSSDGVITLTDEDVDFIKNKAYMTNAYGYYLERPQIKFGNDIESAQGFGVHFSDDFFKDLNVEVEFGRLPKSNEKYAVLVGAKAATDEFDKEIPVGANLYIKDTKFKVVGILKTLGNDQDDSSFFFSNDGFRELYTDKKEVAIIDAIVDEGYDVDNAKENLQLALDNRLGEENVEVITQAQLLDQFGVILGIIQYTLGGIAFVALLVGAFGVINTMYVVVTEKTKEIGIMKSIGARNSDILFMYVFMAGLFGFLGGILGIAFGIVGAFGFEIAAKAAGFGFLEITVDPLIALGMLLFGFLVGAISGYLPARKASQLTIVDTLRK